MESPDSARNVSSPEDFDRSPAGTPPISSPSTPSFGGENSRPSSYINRRISTFSLPAIPESHHDSVRESVGSDMSSLFGNSIDNIQSYLAVPVRTNNESATIVEASSPLRTAPIHSRMASYSEDDTQSEPSGDRYFMRNPAPRSPLAQAPQRQSQTESIENATDGTQSSTPSTAVNMADQRASMGSLAPASQAGDRDSIAGSEYSYMSEGWAGESMEPPTQRMNRVSETFGGPAIGTFLTQPSPLRTPSLKKSANKTPKALPEKMISLGLPFRPPRISSLIRPASLPRPPKAVEAPRPPSLIKGRRNSSPPKAFSRDLTPSPKTIPARDQEKSSTPLAQEQSYNDGDRKYSNVSSNYDTPEQQEPSNSSSASLERTVSTGDMPDYEPASEQDSPNHHKRSKSDESDPFRGFEKVEKKSKRKSVRISGIVEQQILAHGPGPDLEKGSVLTTESQQSLEIPGSFPQPPARPRRPPSSDIPRRSVLEALGRLDPAEQREDCNHNGESQLEDWEREKVPFRPDLRSLSQDEQGFDSDESFGNRASQQPGLDALRNPSVVSRDFASGSFSQPKPSSLQPSGSFSQPVVPIVGLSSMSGGPVQLSSSGRPNRPQVSTDFDEKGAMSAIRDTPVSTLNASVCSESSRAPLFGQPSIDRSNNPYAAPGEQLETNANSCGFLLIIYRNNSPKCLSSRLEIQRSWNDRQFFDAIRQTYMTNLEGQWRKWTSLKCLKRIVPLHYDYENRPIRLYDPYAVSMQDFFYAYDYPESVGANDSAWVQWAFKLKAHSDHRYGLEFIEGWSSFKIGLAGSAIMIATLATGVIWAAIGHDPIKVFTVTVFILLFLIALLVLVAVISHVDE